MADSQLARRLRPPECDAPAFSCFSPRGVFPAVFVVEPRLPIGKVHGPAVDVSCLDLRGDFQWVAGGDDERGVFACFERPEAVPNAKYFGGRKGHRPERLFVRETVRGGLAGLVRQVAVVGGVEVRAAVGDAKAHTRRVQLGRVGVRGVERLPTPQRDRVHWADDHRHVMFLEQGGDPPSVLPADEHELEFFIGGPPHGVFDLANGVGVDKDRQLAAQDGREGRQPHVGAPGVAAPGRPLVRPGGGEGLAQPAQPCVDPFLLIVRADGEARVMVHPQLRPENVQAHVGLDRHALPRPAVEIQETGNARD